MKTRVLLASVLVVLAATAGPAPAAEHNVLVPVWQKVLARDGKGEWDYCVPRDGQGETQEGESRRGEAVDNRGRIYFCDSFNDRILVFSPDGERLSVNNLKGLLKFPSDIHVDDADNLYVTGGAPDSGGEAEIIARLDGNRWENVPLDASTCERPQGMKVEPCGKQIIPLGYGALRALPVLVDGAFKYQLLDVKGGCWGFAPSRYRDQQGRFYEIGGNENEVHMFNAAGEPTVVVTTPDSPARTVPYRGYIYVYAGHMLYRYGEDGAIEETVESSSKKRSLWPPFLASPLADHFYTYHIVEEKNVETFTVTKWEYRKGTPESGDSAATTK